MKNNINEVLNHYIVYENGDIYDKDREKYVNVHKTDKGYYAFYDVCHQAISNIKMHKIWTHLTDNIDFPNIKKSKVKSSTTIPLVTGM